MADTAGRLLLISLLSSRLSGGGAGVGSRLKRMKGSCIAKYYLEPELVLEQELALERGPKECCNWFAVADQRGWREGDREGERHRWSNRRHHR